MSFTKIEISDSLAKKINIFCLLAAIFIIIVLPLKKEMWYDETISILCSKGITHDTPAAFANTSTINSATIQGLNTAGNVFNATVADNANSFLYNICLHWFTMLFGNSVGTYVAFSKLLAIATIIAFYFLCSLFFGHALFTSLAILLLVTDNNFSGMSHEIRAYAMCIFFVTIGALYCFRYVYKQQKWLYLFLTGIFSAAALLSHFLSIYIILFFLGLLFLKKEKHYSPRANLIALLFPVVLLGFFFLFAYPGVHTMSVQNQHIQQRTAADGFSLADVVLQAGRLMAINYRVVFPAFTIQWPIIIFSVVLVLCLYVYASNVARDGGERNKLHALFIPGLAATLFLAALCIKSHHYTALYYRYFSFSIPFCCLFMSYVIYVVTKNPVVNASVKVGLMFLILLPELALFIAGVNGTVHANYSHTVAAKAIEKENIRKVEVPAWEDALLLQCLLPGSYKIDYFRKPGSSNFELFAPQVGWRRYQW